MLSRHVTQRMIDDYAKASGDFNPIHVDPDFARNGPFGRTIAHGLMTLAFVAQMLNAWTDGAFDESGEIDVDFRRARSSRTTCWRSPAPSRRSSSATERLPRA